MTALSGKTRGQQIFFDSLSAAGLVGTYGLGQYDKVWDYLVADPSQRDDIFVEEGAPKTFAFSADLQGNLQMVCVDSHIALGSVGGLDVGGTVKFTLRIYRQIAGAIVRIAKRVGMKPAQVQAIIWIVRKRILDNAEFSSGIWVDLKELRKVKNPRDTSFYMEAGWFDDHFDNGRWLEWLFEQATPWEIQEGKVWYDDAILEIAKLSAELGVTPRYLADVVAMISPGREWSRNIDQAVEVIHCYRWATRDQR